jgi:hypothetical protein
MLSLCVSGIDIGNTGGRIGVRHLDRCVTIGRRSSESSNGDCGTTERWYTQAASTDPSVWTTRWSRFRHFDRDFTVLMGAWVAPEQGQRWQISWMARL